MTDSSRTVTDSAPPARLEIRLESDAEAVKTVQRAVLAGLLACNHEHAGESHQAALTLSARLPDDSVAGGLVGVTAWGWLYVHLLWVEEPHRRRGIGRELLRAAESEAQRRGCAAACLDTLDFQAPQFYEREGYTVFGVLENFPPGHRRLYMRKSLARHAGPGSEAPPAS
jgi:GNAT superfamily N-acetyltransferase